MSWRRILVVCGCILPWIVAAGGVIWVIQQHVPKDGTFALDIPVDGRSPWLEVFLPGQRASSPGVQEEGWIGQRITDEPVYARLRLPGAYDTAELSVEFQPHDQPLLEVGVERGVEPSTAFELRPLWSQELQQSGFVSTTIDGVRWLIDPEAGSRALATNAARVHWHASGTKPEAWSDTGERTTQVVQASLRGQHDFWFIPLNGEVDLSMILQDMNRSRESSSAVLRLMRDDQLIWTDSVSFGGRDDARASPLVEKQWHFAMLVPGVYKFSVLADDSIFIRGWTTTAKHWVVGPRVYFADEVGYSTSTPSVHVWTNASYVEVKTLHQEGLQTVQLGSASTTLRETHVTELLARPVLERQGPVILSAPQGNIWTLGDGYVSWTKEALFFPHARRLTDQTRIKTEGVRAVATRYESPEQLADGWYRAKATFRLEPDRDRLKVILAAPGLAHRNTMVDIRRIQVIYRRPPRHEAWWPALRVELLRAWRRW